MKKSVLISAIVILAVLVALFVFLNRGSTPSETTQLQNQISENEAKITEEVKNQQENSGTSTTPKTHIVEITSSGFSPNILTINKGDTVTWVNKASRDSWPASDVHPIHTVYPGSSISKCGTSEENNIFDACKGIPPGGSWSFIFNEVGSWKYHDHLQSSVTGTIVVQ